MARRIHTRYRISGTLIARSPIHVGGLGGNADTDLALAVDGEGKYYIPGTSLAGALRAWMELIDSKATDYLWGSKSDRGHASFILIENAPIDLLAMGMGIEIRDGVGIDRNWGTAFNRMKYDRTILPKGIKIPLKLTLERSARRTDDEKLSDDEWTRSQSKFAQLLTNLIEGQLSIGAAKTRGLGRVQLDRDSLQIGKEELGTPQGMEDVLLRGASLINRDEFLALDHSFSPARLDIKIHWKPVNTVLVKAEGEGIAVDMLPLVSGINGDLTFVIPGSSIKGAMRSQAERIIRTVLRHKTPKNDFSQQIQIPLVKTLFGEAGDERNQLGYLSTLAVDDCFANIPLTQEKWAEVEKSTDELALRKALNDSNLNHTQQSFHIAIDRWTGGAAEGNLYTILEPMGFSWQPIDLRLNLTRLKNREKHELEYLPTIALLLFVLRDLMNSRIPLGFGTNRGMGAIEVEKIEITGKQLEEIQNLENVTLTKQDLSDLDTRFIQNLSEQWQTWINLKKEQND